ncbi:unnamed protein product [Amoebophrya sp. A25]|nr:unnamed protein product [Amoebophrya sp. A25]|eukprot:GSA25T00020059001.1
MLVLLTNLTQYFYKPSQRTAAVLMLFATFFLSLGPLRNMCFAICTQSFKLTGFDPTIEMVLEVSFNPLMSRRLIQWYTAAGTLFLLAATALHTNFFTKISLHLAARTNTKRCPSDEDSSMWSASSASNGVVTVDVDGEADCVT